MTYPVVNEKRLKLLTRGESREPTVLYKHLKTLKLERQLGGYPLKDLSIPKDIYDKIMEEYDLDYKRLELWINKTNINTYNELCISLYAGNLSSKEVLDFVLEDGYDIDIIDEYEYRYTTSASTVPNILFRITDRTFGLNKTNYLAKLSYNKLIELEEKNKVILDNLAIVNKRMGLTQ